MDAQPKEDVKNNFIASLHRHIPTRYGIPETRGHLSSRYKKFPAPEVTVSPICEFCDYLLSNLGPDPNDGKRFYNRLDYGATRTQSIEQFKNSADDESCHFCRLRWNQLSDKQKTDITEGWGRFRVEIFFKNSGFGMSVTFYYLLNGGKECSHSVDVIECEDLVCLPQNYLSTSNNSPVSWSLANFWLNHCEENHEICRSLAPKARQLPTRLVDLGAEPDAICPRICQTASLSPDTRYTTLSHRWGDETKTCQLKIAVEQSWSKGLPLEKLPTMFKEAMEATKRLGMRYIWIDSLCIIQDSTADWKKEAFSMSDVYRNSVCNLTAAKGETGLFTKRSLADINLCVVQPTNFIGLGARTPPYYCFDSSQWQTNIDWNPLFERGWVYQERVLAPRCLHFTKTQVYWECLHFIACENLPAGIPNHRHVKPTTHTVHLAGGGYSAGVTSEDEEKKRYILWGRTIDDYTSTYLTYPDKDKLAALSGIAKGIGLPVEDYIAGMWKKYLLNFLFWRPYAIERPKIYQAPSWSWVSVNGSVGMNSYAWGLSYREAFLTSILESSVTLETQDPTGPVRDGYLHLRGPMARVPSYKVSEDVDDFKKQSSANTSVIVQRWGYLYFDLQSDLSDFKDFNQPLYFLLIAYTDDISSGMIRGILLTPTGLVDGSFYRRGTFSTGQDTKKVQLLIDVFNMPMHGDDPCLRGLKQEANHITEDGKIFSMYNSKII